MGMRFRLAACGAACLAIGLAVLVPVSATASAPDSIRPPFASATAQYSCWSGCADQSAGGSASASPDGDFSIAIDPVGRTGSLTFQHAAASITANDVLAADVPAVTYVARVRVEHLYASVQLTHMAL